MSTRSEYAAIAEKLARIDAERSAAEIHGVLCGALCVLPESRVDLIAMLELSQSSPENITWMHNFCHAVSESLGDLESSFTPLLPDDADSLSGRTQALSFWCQGFLFGLAGSRKLELAACSEEVREVVADFTEFTRATLADGDNLEAEEEAYTELVEYIRVGAQLVFVELRGMRSRDSDHAKLH